MKHTYASKDIRRAGPVYLDCNATTPMEPEVEEAVTRWFRNEVGNAGSRTHEYGLRAKRAVQEAREHVGNVVNAAAHEVVFTSGATESNNLAILGLAKHAEKVGRRHIVTTAIEHKAVLEPIEELEKRGFEVTRINPEESGAVLASSIKSALSSKTLLVSVMHVNNETGVLQPLQEIAALMADHDAYLHVDAAQGYGKELTSLRENRIDFISVSAHKVYGPGGIGALIARRRGFEKPPLTPLAYGGGQEGGMRPGTLPVPLIVGFGVAAKQALSQHSRREKRCRAILAKALPPLERLGVRIHGNPSLVLPHVLNFSVPGVDSEAIMIALKGVAAVSNGSACTSQSYQPSHVLAAMDLPREAIEGAVRVSWCHMTPDVDWQTLAHRIAVLN